MWLRVPVLYHFRSLTDVPETGLGIRGVSLPAEPAAVEDGEVLHFFDLSFYFPSVRMK